MTANETKEERNKRAVMEIWEGFYNQGDVNAFLDNAAEDYIWKSDTLYPFPGVVVGTKLSAEYTAKISEVLPGVYGQVLFLEASNNTVTLISHTHALRSNGYLGLPPIDRPIQFHQCLISTLTEEGKVREQWFFYDRVHILQQLGVLPIVSVFGGPGSENWFEYINPRFLVGNKATNRSFGFNYSSQAGASGSTYSSLLSRMLTLPHRLLFGRGTAS